MTIAVVLEILANPATNSWVKQEYHKSFNRDPVDALNDAELLAAMLKVRLESIERSLIP